MTLEFYPSAVDPSSFSLVPLLYRLVHCLFAARFACVHRWSGQRQGLVRMGTEYHARIARESAERNAPEQSPVAENERRKHDVRKTRQVEDGKRGGMEYY